MPEHITRENVLDLLESFGRRMKHLTYPSAHPYDDPQRAKPYEARHRAAQLAWQAVRNGADPKTTIQDLSKKIHGGEQNALGLILHALDGEFEQDDAWFVALPNEIAHHWVTNGGDFYSVRNGDKLNLGCVSRVANKNLPPERRTTTGSQRLASLMPNHCTRITAPVQFS